MLGINSEQRQEYLTPSLHSNIPSHHLTNVDTSSDESPQQLQQEQEEILGDVTIDGTTENVDSNMDSLHEQSSPGIGRTTPTHEPRRRVSIASDPVSDNRLHVYTNEGFEPRRRISVISDQVVDGRRKSILHNPDTISVGSHHENGKPAFGDPIPLKKYSMTESYSEKTKHLHQPEDGSKSWWFVFCKKCRQEETTTSWEPPHWQRLCPYPFCPTYRQFARILALVIVGVLVWGVVYCIMGDEAAPGGQLFHLALLALAAYFGGWLISLVTLPPLLGMLFVGIILQNVGLVHLNHDYSEMVTILRKIALVIILTRAGLDLDPSALKRLRVTVVKLGLGPWLIECIVMAIMSHFLLGMPWIWGFMLGSVIAAVSPAVVVSCLFRLRRKGYGMAKGIPTLIIAVSGIDDASSVAAFGILYSILFSNDSLVYQVLQGPLSIVGGIGFGVLWGFMAKYVPEKDDPFVVPLRILMLFGGGLITVLGSEVIGFGGAGPLGCVTAAFVSIYFWSQQGWEIEDNPAATAFEIFWMIFEPILFGITGTQIKINELDSNTVYYCLACLIAGIVVRIIGTVILGIGSKLNLKEKIFVALSWMSKATVQAALAPVALDYVNEAKLTNLTGHAKTFLMVCVLSILLSAPVGAVLITLSGPRLLKKTTVPAIVEGWRRSARPSLRDISIIDEEEDNDDTIVT